MTKVEVSTRLTESPAALVQSAYGLSPQMQKYYKAQAVLQDDDASALGGQFNQVRLVVQKRREEAGVRLILIEIEIEGEREKGGAAPLAHSSVVATAFADSPPPLRR